MNQEPIPQEEYGKQWWNNNPFWIYGHDEKAKRRSEGCAPYLTLEAFDAWESKILDAGAGRGWLSKFLSEYGADVAGLDYSEYAIENKVFDNLIKGDMTNLPFDKDSFDLVISRENFEHLTLDQSDKAFEEMLRVSKKYIYLTIWMNFDPNASDDIVLTDTDKDPTHITFCTRTFWNKRFIKYLDNGTLKQRADLEKVLDWKNKGRCFVFEKVK